MEGLVESPGNSTRAGDFHDDARSRRASSGDARNDGYRAGSAAALDGGVQARLRGYGQRDRLPANEKISRLRRGSCVDARSDGYRAGSAAALDGRVQARLQGYGQRDRLPANEKISWAVVTPAHVVKITINIINAPVVWHWKVSVRNFRKLALALAPVGAKSWLVGWSQWVDATLA